MLPSRWYPNIPRKKWGAWVEAMQAIQAGNVSEMFFFFFFGSECLLRVQTCRSQSESVCWPIDPFSVPGSTKTEEAPPRVAVPPPAKEAPRGGFLLSLTQLVFRPTKPTEQGPPGNKLPCTLQRGIFAIGSDVVVEGLMKCPVAWLMTLPNLSRYILFRSFQIFSDLFTQKSLSTSIKSKMSCPIEYCNFEIFLNVSMYFWGFQWFVWQSWEFGREDRTLWSYVGLQLWREDCGQNQGWTTWLARNKHIIAYLKSSGVKSLCLWIEMAQASKRTYITGLRFPYPWKPLGRWHFTCWLFRWKPTHCSSAATNTATWRLPTRGSDCASPSGPSGPSVLNWIVQGYICQGGTVKSPGKWVLTSIRTSLYAVLFGYPMIDT